MHRAYRPDAQAFDEIRITTIPRFKESEMSGSEWRISARVEFFRNGELKHVSEGWRDVETASKFLAYLHATACDEGKAYFAGEDDFCDQEGCAEKATVSYRCKKRYCNEGHASEPHRFDEIRCFCDRHSRRGDSSLDDCDDNYEKIDR